MATQEIDDFTPLAEGPAVGDLFVIVDSSDTTDSPQGTTKKNEARFGIGHVVNAQTGTSYTVLATDFRKLVTHTNGASIAVTLPQASATFPAGWFYFTQNRGAGAVTITPTTSTIDGAATLVLNQNEGALIVSDGTNYFSMRGKATGGVGGVGDVVGPGSATDNALARFDSTTGKLIQSSTVTLDDTGAFTIPEMAAPSTPASGKVAVYAKVDGLVYSKDDAGTEKLLSGGVIPFEFTVAVSDESTAITTGAAKITFYFPVAVNITGVSAGLSTQSSSGAITIDVNKGGTTIFSTNLTIDANEDTSHTAATPAALTSSPTAFALTDKVTIDIDGAGTGAKGLKVSFTGTRQ
jgi:hypothetical protein